MIIFHVTSKFQKSQLIFPTSRCETGILNYRVAAVVSVALLIH